MFRSTAGEMAINAALPHELRRYNGALNLDKKGLSDLLEEVARRRPDKYDEVASALVRIGGQAAASTGGFSFGADRLTPGPVARRMIDQLRGEIEDIVEDDDLSESARSDRLASLMAARFKPLNDALMDEEATRDNPIVHQIRSGAKGTPANLMTLLVGDLLYTDASGRPVPVPILRGYGQGLRPTEYLAGAAGARKGVVELKSATPKGGYLSKQLSQLAHRLVVTSLDRDGDGVVDGPARGLAVPAADADNDGALLATDVGPYKRNQVITPRMRKRLQALGHEEILVRSPLVGGPPEGGVYGRDVGVRERGAIAPSGDFVGIAAANALSEPITQSLIGSKHSGGVAGQGPAMGAFESFDRMAQIPKAYGGAAHAQADGKVRAIKPAPQGGQYVVVGDREHYVDPSQKSLVKVGDEVEAGDVLSDGLPNPGEIVRHKGVGEGRRAFVAAVMDVFKKSGVGANRRNVELVARGLIDHVEFDSDHGVWGPGDVAPYSAVEASWEPREGARDLAPNSAVGRFLERPALHYSVGTRITPSVARSLAKWGINTIHAHDAPPPFAARMIPARENLRRDPDLLTRHLGSNLSRSTLDAVHSGAVVDPGGTSFVPGLARRADFGRVGATQGWDPAKLRPIAPDDDDDDDDFL